MRSSRTVEQGISKTTDCGPLIYCSPVRVWS